MGGLGERRASSLCVLCRSVRQYCGQLCLRPPFRWLYHGLYVDLGSRTRGSHWTQDTGSALPVKLKQQAAGTAMHHTEPACLAKRGKRDSCNNLPHRRAQAVGRMSHRPRPGSLFGWLELPRLASPRAREGKGKLIWKVPAHSTRRCTCAGRYGKA